MSPLPEHSSGSLTVNSSGIISFTPPDGFTGNYVFQYRLTNVRGTSDGQSVWFTMQAANKIAALMPPKK